MVLNREELAWAAGFYDGEGHTKKCVRAGRARHNAQMSVAQVVKENLERFRNAVGGLGKIYGPYKPKTPKSKPYYVWVTTKLEHLQAVGAMLWSFLSFTKREQLKQALLSKQVPYLKFGPKRKQFCIRGHNLYETRYTRPNGGAGGCRVCANLRRRLCA